MPATQHRWGSLLRSQDKTALYDVRSIRTYKVEEALFDDKTGESGGGEINAYYTKREAETLARYYDESRAKEVFNDLCAVLWNGEIADFTLPPDVIPDPNDPFAET